MNDSLFDFVPAVFWKVLAATLTVVMLGGIGAICPHELPGLPVIGRFGRHRWVGSIASNHGNPVLDPSPGASARTAESDRYR